MSVDWLYFRWWQDADGRVWIWHDCVTYAYYADRVKAIRARHTPEGASSNVGLLLAEIHADAPRKTHLQSGAPDAPRREHACPKCGCLCACVGGDPRYKGICSHDCEAPDAPRAVAHCPCCRGYSIDDLGCRGFRKDPCPGIAPAPPALSAEEIEALEWVLAAAAARSSPHRLKVRTHIATVEALLARTAEAK